jgi:hypothetical protein
MPSPSENPALLSFQRRQEAARIAQAQARAATESGARTGPSAARSGEGDHRRLRGIPVVGGVSGVIPGTQPEQAAIRRLTPRR